MNKKVTVDELAKAINDTLTDFVGVTEEACEKGVLETADDALKALRAANPKGSGEYSSWSKNYDRGWTIRKEYPKRMKAKGILAILWNPVHYRLTHLLEKGHAIKRGGRKIGEAQAFPHIEQVAERAEGELLFNIRKNL